MTDRLETTLDTALGGALTLRQPARGHGYRFNVDALLLAREASLHGHARRALDLGAGVGAVGLTLLTLRAATSLTLVERDPAIASLCHQNATPFAPHTTVLTASVDDLPASLAPFDAIVCNPPYTPPGRGQQNPEPRRDQSRRGPLAPFLDAIARLLAPDGRAHLVYPAEALTDLLTALPPRSLSPRALRFVHPHAHSPARVALLTTTRAPLPLRLDAPLIERTATDRPDPALEAFLRSPPP